MAKSKTGLTKEHYYRIGLIITRCAEIETYTERLIWWLIGIPAVQGTLFTGSMIMHKRLTLAQNLAEQRLKDKAKLKEFKEICKITKKLFGLRNILVHGTWMMNKKTGEPQAIGLPETPKDLKNITSKAIPFPIAYLDEIAQTSEDIAKYLDLLWRDTLSDPEQLYKAPPLHNRKKKTRPRKKSVDSHR